MNIAIVFSVFKTSPHGSERGYEIAKPPVFFSSLAVIGGIGAKQGDENDDIGEIKQDAPLQKIAKNKGRKAYDIKGRI